MFCAGCLVLLFRLLCAASLSPAAVDPAVPASSPAAGATDNPDEVAANWATGTDPKSGKIYYYNKITKKTSWSKPSCMPATATPAAAAPAAAATPAVAATPAAATPAATAAPAATGTWVEAKDPASGKVSLRLRQSLRTEQALSHSLTLIRSRFDFSCARSLLSARRDCHYTVVLVQQGNEGDHMEGSERCRSRCCRCTRCSRSRCSRCRSCCCSCRCRCACPGCLALRWPRGCICQRRTEENESEGARG